MFQSLSNNLTSKTTSAIVLSMSSYKVANNFISTSKKALLYEICEEKLYTSIKRRGRYSNSKFTDFEKGLQSICNFLNYDIDISKIPMNQHILIPNSGRLFIDKQSNTFISISESDYKSIMSTKGLDKFSLLNTYLAIKSRIYNVNRKSATFLNGHKRPIAYPSLETIMHDANIASRTTAIKYIQTLKQMKIIWYDNFSLFSQNHVRFANVYADYKDARHIYDDMKFKVSTNSSLTNSEKNEAISVIESMSKKCS